MKAVERERVVANDQMGVERDLLADGGDVTQGLRGHRGAIADAAAEQQDVVGATDGDLAAQQADHRGLDPAGGGGGG